MTRSRFGEVGRFGVVGLAAYATDLLVFNALLLGVGVPSVPAKVVAGAVAIAVAYAGSRWWTWRDRRGPDVGREYALFLLFSVLAAGLQVACLVVSRELLGLRSAWADNVSANVVGMAIATAFRFWTFRTFVFPDRRRRRAGTGGIGQSDVGPGDVGPGDVRPGGDGRRAPAGDAARS